MGCEACIALAPLLCGLWMLHTCELAACCCCCCCRTTLVICPVVAVIQWRQEIARYTTPGSVKVCACRDTNTHMRSHTCVHTCTLTWLAAC